MSQDTLLSTRLALVARVAFIGIFLLMIVSFSVALVIMGEASFSIMVTLEAVSLLGALILYDNVKTLKENWDKSPDPVEESEEDYKPALKKVYAEHMRRVHNTKQLMEDEGFTPEDYAEAEQMAKDAIEGVNHAE
jgi:hypothetical protein